MHGLWVQHRVRLTPAVIHQTFAEKPAIRRAFVAQVPHNMTELAFWTKYMRLQYKEQVLLHHPPPSLTQENEIDIGVNGM